MRFVRAIALLAAASLLFVAGANAEQSASADRPLQAGWLDAGGSFACAINGGGGAVCWGADGSGQLGNGPVLTGDQASPTPVQLPPGRRAVAISASPDTSTAHACAVLDDGGAVCWGSDTYGVLGNGPGVSGDQPAPTAVVLPAGRRATAISAGSFDTCAVLDDGSAACWGNDGNGRLGNGALLTGDQQSPTPVLLPAGRRATAISAGESHACALLDDASVVCWGNDGLGQLGNGPLVTADQPSPVGVVGLPPASAISVGPQHSCAVLVDGGAMCWGYEFGGKLGDGVSTGTIKASPTAVLVPAPYRVTAISSGVQQTCVALDDRGVRCFGFEISGALGNAITLPGSAGDLQSTPVLTFLPSQRSETAITVGLNFGCAALDDGSVVCWGWDASGRLGNGPLVTADRSDPRTVPLTLSAGSVPALVADLSVTITPTTTALRLGEAGPFTVRVADAGPDGVAGVVVGLRAVGVVVAGTTPSQGTVTGATWNVGTIPRGGQATLVVNARGATAGPGALVAEVQTAGALDPDSTPANGRGGEDDQATAAIAVTTDAAAAGGRAGSGATAGAPRAVGRVRPRGLTLRVTRVGRRLRFAGSLAIPRSAACRGAVRITARHGRRIVKRTTAKLASRRGRCVYSRGVADPGGSLRVTARFGGNAGLLPRISAVRRA